MANNKRKTAHPERYKTKTRLTYLEVMDYAGISRSTVFAYVSKYHLPVHKFENSCTRYFTKETAELLYEFVHIPGALDDYVAIQKTSQGVQSIANAVITGAVNCAPTSES
jgi:hypothetical protein